MMGRDSKQSVPFYRQAADCMKAAENNLKTGRSMKMEIGKICVLGAGLMGNGIVQICAQAGYRVAMRDVEQRFIDSGMNTIRKNLSNDVKKGKKTQEAVDEILSRITPTIDLKEAAGDADVVVEVIIEVMDVKK